MDTIDGDSTDTFEPDIYVPCEDLAQLIAPTDKVVLTVVLGLLGLLVGLFVILVCEAPRSVLAASQTK